ncbi:MAG: aminotransferase [Bacteroidetes bacterium GWF2_40_14]|nr:MAG: aminotransferase [Bacteroidetes bacterium GWF2_40_14]
MEQKDEKRTKIQPSSRSETIQEYYFSRKLREIDQMRIAGTNIINLGIGSPDLPPSPSIVKVLAKSAEQENNHGYQSYAGIPELRKAFSEWYKRYFDVMLDPETEILPLMGSKEGIMHISMAFVNPMDKVLVPNPGYPTYTSVTKLAGGEIINYNLLEENKWYPRLEQLEDTDLSNIKMMWLNYPHMPTGQKANKKLFEELVAFAHKHNILLCNDNPYSFILNKEHLSLLSVDGAKEVALELNSMSKSHNMPGWRIGMVAGHKDYISSIIKVKSNMDSGMFKPLQLAAVEALNSGDEWYESVNETYKRRRVKAEEIMTLLKCTYDKKQSGLFLWGKVPEEYKNGEELTEMILHNAHVFITPGFIFGSQGDKYVRISLCAREELLNNTIERIKQIL